MSFQCLWTSGVALSLATSLAGPARSEAELGGEVTVASAYLWRGLTVVNRPVLQPSLYLTGPLGPFSVTGSLWSNIEIGKYDGRSDISESGGTSAFNLAELDPSLEVSLPLDDHVVALGIDGFYYPNSSGYTSADTAAEIFLRLDLDLPAAPSLGIWRDIAHVDGWYAELSLSHSFPLGESVSLDVSGAAGWSISQAEDLHGDGRVRTPGNFADDGFTHAEGGVSLSFAWGEVQLQPWLRTVVAADPWVEIASGTDSHDVKVWGGLTLSGTLLSPDADPP